MSAAYSRINQMRGWGQLQSLFLPVDKFCLAGSIVLLPLPSPSQLKYISTSAHRAAIAWFQPVLRSQWSLISRKQYGEVLNKDRLERRPTLEKLKPSNLISFLLKVLREICWMSECSFFQAVTSLADYFQFAHLLVNGRTEDH